MKNSVDFTALQGINDDIVGWLKVGALDISYPVTQASDNDYYLHLTFELVQNAAGCIFVDYQNRPDFQDDNTIIYGHNMKDGSMYEGLQKYEDKTFLKDHKDLTIYTPDSILKYRIFAAYLTDNRHVLMYYNQGKDEESRETYLKDILEQRNMNASIDTKAKVDKDSKILTLSTCHAAGKNYRYLVQAYLVKEEHE